jgi:hypothetical protein
MALNIRRIGHAFRWSVLTLLIGCSEGASDRGSAQAQRLRWDSLGVVVGDGDPSFHPVDLVDPRGILSDPSGLMVVAEADLHQVLLLDSAGTIVHRLGRQGIGPGEFDAPSLVAFWGESLAVYDPALHRLSILRVDGALIRQQAIEPKGLIYPSIVGIRNDGTPILMGIQVAEASAEGGVSSTLGLVIALRDDERRDTLATLEGGPILSRGPIFFAPRPAAAITDTGAWVGFGGAPEIRFVPFDGSSARSYRWTATARPVSEGDKALVRAYAADRRANPEVTGDDRFADSIPYFKTILPDPAGGVWLVGYSALGTAPDSAWRVNERTGTIHRIQLPAGFRPAEIGTRDLIGVQIDSEGAQRLARYRRGRH